MGVGGLNRDIIVFVPSFFKIYMKAQKSFLDIPAFSDSLQDSDCNIELTKYPFMFIIYVKSTKYISSH
jgi:hypothetical protein